MEQRPITQIMSFFQEQLDLLEGVAKIIVDLVKAASEPTIPSNYRNNREAYRKDLWTLDNKTFQKNLKNGKYK